MAAIKPGSSLGFLNLGDSLQYVLATLRANTSTFPRIQVIYSQESPIDYPIIVLLETNGLRLQFDGREQYLRLIEVVQWGKMKIVYKNSELGKQGFLSFRNIYSKTFGPTYPGVYDTDTSTYVLSYPGVAFTFDIPRDVNTRTHDEFVKYLSGADAPSCSSMAIFKGHSWPEAKDEIFSPGVMRRAPSSDNEPAIDIDYVDIKLDDRVLTVHFYGHPRGLSEYDIALDSTTMQDIIMTLGPPTERFFKQDSKLSIHNPEEGDYKSSDLFFNYCALGFDICFDTTRKSPTVKKVILHGNIPGSLPFHKYKRCRWKLSDDATSELKFKSYADKYMATDRPMILNRQLESPSSSVELVGDVSDGIEDWGLTDLYGCQGCVFEVLKNDSVVTLTLY